MKSFFTAMAVLCATALFAQSRTVSGTYLDAESQPIPLATVLLSDTAGTLVKAGATDMDGAFRVVAPKDGLYQLAITAIGFKAFVQALELAGADLDLGPLTGVADAEVLGSAEITAKKPLVSVDPDKTVLNVAEHLSASGDNGLELLRKAPGVMVDNNENIMVEGKSGIQVFIDGRPSPLRGEDLTNYLKSLQSTDVESVEIITQPSSKYDAAGNAGIINIILKREKGLGTNGTVNAGYVRGERNRYNGSVSINHRNTFMNAFGNYGLFTGESTGFMNFYREQNGYTFDSKTNSMYNNENHNAQLGADFYVGKRSTIGFLASANTGQRSDSTVSNTPIYSPSSAVVDSILYAPTVSDAESINASFNINYRFEDTTGVSFSADLDYGQYTRDRLDFQPNFYLDPDGVTVLNERTTRQETPIDIELYSAKADYERPAFGGTFATGVKWADVRTDNTLDAYNVVSGEAALDSSRSNNFTYREQVYAAYINQQYTWGKWGLQAGLRMEHTESLGELTAFQETDNDRVQRSYTNLFPSAGLTFQQNMLNTWSLIYSRRIERPDYASLNPFEYQLNELSFMRGNPFLQPQYTENIKLTHTWRYTLNTSFSFSYISDFYAQVTQAEDQVRNFLTTLNVADQQIYNLSVSYPMQIKEWWNVYANIYGYYAKYTANDPLFVPIDQLTYGGYAQSTFTLNPAWSLEVSGWFSSPSIWGGTYRTASLGALNTGVKYQFSPRGTLRMSVNDILYTQPWEGETEFADVRINGTGGSDSRQFRINVSWRFGDAEVKELRKRKTGLENEQGRIGG